MNLSRGKFFISSILVLLTFAILFIFLLHFRTMRKNLSIEVISVETKESVSNTSGIKEESSPAAESPLKCLSTRFFATTDPNHQGFRNEMTFQSVQAYFGRQHPPSERAYNYGGHKSKCTLEIVEVDGIPIGGASVDVGPSLNWSRLPLQQYVTDSSGILVISDKNANEYHVHVSKDGYYDTDGTIQFFSHHYICVEDGRWMPWNPHVELVLKKKGGFVRLAHLKSSEHNPRFSSDTDVPFDFLCCDFLPPYGNGRETNAMVRMSGSIDGNGLSRSVTSISFPRGGGMRKEGLNGFSRFAFPREISEGAFSESLTIRRECSCDSGEKIVGGIIREKEYFALKIPTTTEVGTNGFLYGVITKGPTAYLVDKKSKTAALFMEYYLNTEVGNRVIESKELIGK